MNHSRLEQKTISIFKQTIIYLHVIWLAILIDILLPVVSLPRIINYMHKSRRLLPVDIGQLILVIDRVSDWRFFVVRQNCLKKSLLLYYFINRVGEKNIELCIGFDKIGSVINGHSWLLRNGYPVLDDPDFISQYIVIQSFTPEHKNDY